MRKGMGIGAVVLAAAGVASVASGGLVIESMSVINGVIDLANPPGDPGNFFNVTLDEPGVGSYINFGVGGPGPGGYTDVLSTLIYSSGGPFSSTFTFVNNLSGPAYEAGETEIAVAMNLLVVTTDLPLIVQIVGGINGHGGGAGFFQALGSDAVNFLPGGDPVVFTVTLEAGTNTIAWGSGVLPSGGGSFFSGTMVLIEVPSPGAVALLAVAGLVGASRRRR